MQELFDGAIKFRENDFKNNKEHFQEINDAQNPHTLFIGCSDSRVVPNLITQTLPGDLFVIRNIANVVPKYRKTPEYVATTSAIEYAINILEVENIVVCGHSNCGGCGALHQPDDFFHNISHTKKWLELTGNVKSEVDKRLDGCDDNAVAILTEQLNIVEQLNHLLTYPYIKERYGNGKIKLLGWYYQIETGEVYNYNFDSKLFECIM